MDTDTRQTANPDQFKTTQWHLVQSADDVKAMDALVRIYWKPLYFFVRHHGHDRETAKDVVQEFLAGLMRRGSILKADPARGRFRTFLRAALLNFLRDRSKAAARRKRKAERRTLSLDFARGETDYALQVTAGESPERVLNRAWARSLWEHALEELKGQPAHLEAFRFYLEDRNYGAIASRTGLSVTAAKAAVHRLKAQLRDIIIGRIRETVNNKEDLKAELAEFKSLLS